ncbi:MAG: 16S rRNA (cytidine(1402)-2'-O)-methyltransferase [Candidatus Saccharicenans sp.]|nr:MAG: 16S rRNA (cytidine(1402)-2'-O)-methyltransferase [Candidatus Aminicenantes bacterium]HEK86383.1 16S rRNA (cytidine(1402)-2'-O)-methyltransferase [Candidatus Aminicenantes bacterium]
MSQKGCLYVVATPIGNLEDITIRALRILKEVEVVACEDTRQTIKLLNYYGLKKTLISYFHPRENQKVPEIISILKRGQNVALVSDAGTPGISDPGYPLIREAIKEGISVIPIPGPSSLTAALSAAGLPTYRFLFVGFPPVKKGSLKNFLSRLSEEEGTLIFFLPIRKINDFIDIATSIFGPRQVVIAREITKLHEEFIRGTLTDILNQLPEERRKGEATILIEGKKIFRKNT